ncbi:MAG: S8 family serine peptidase [Muribaculaceae bacterium]|nr:S8 family serine peptidase [Muribaculaceae bacterium]
MKKLLSLAILSFMGLGAASAPNNTLIISDINTLNASSSRFECVPGEIIVKFKNTSRAAVRAPQAVRFRTTGVSAVDRAFAELGVAEIEQLMPLTGDRSTARPVRAYNGRIIEAAPMHSAYRLRLAAGSDVHKAVAKLSELADIEFAEPNFTVHALGGDITTPDDPYYNLQYGIRDINLFELWAQSVVSKESPVIAILDTGVDIDHPDLAANIWTNEAELGGATDYDDDNNGYTDDLHGWDFVNQTGRIGDYNGHGTHCAGIAAACGYNGLGIIGANPNARIMPLTVLQSTGQGDVATIIKAIDYAAANGAQVISMSLGTYAESMALEQALGRAYQKAVIIAAAGNDGLCLNHAHPEKGQMAPAPMFPAAYTFVLGVQASAAGGGLAGFSNYDDNGAVFSAYSEEKLYNYEITAPGVAVMSTYPGGGYKQLNGTSMATPLVAGAVSRLLQSKEYDNRELLFGDLINSVNAIGNIDIAAAYRIKDADRKPTLALVSYRLDDGKEGDGDGRVDAGETVYIYPKFRNSWGTAKNIRYSIALDELEDPSTVEILSDMGACVLSQLSSYATVEAQVPFALKFNKSVVDGRQVKMRLTATCDNITEALSQDLIFTVENGVELGGVLREDMTLYPDQHYIVTTNFAVPEGVTLTILPGTTIKMKDGTSFAVGGKIIANGEPGNMITFTKADLGLGDVNGIVFGENKVSYIQIVDLTINSFKFDNYAIVENSIIKNVHTNYGMYGPRYVACNIHNMIGSIGLMGSTEPAQAKHSNIINNYQIASNPYYFFVASSIESSNIYSNRYVDNLWSMAYYKEDPSIYSPKQPNYVGSSRYDKAKRNVADINAGWGMGEYDLSNMLTRPVAEAHGIVWKVVVNGYDAQDDYDIIPALGVGRHKFEVYFNRPMNKAVAPIIAMGVRPPYTQTAIAEDGSWNEAGDIYTAWLTISGRSSYDGMNRIYVAGAEDDEFFEIPLENVRFNVNVQAAGSLSEGFSAEAGVGRVKLDWENSEENFDDMLGYNMYRYTVDAEGAASDTIRVNERLIEPAATALTDYEVVPGTTYCYFYRVMRTDMSENSPSKTVAVTPLTAVAGDANGSGEVDVADVITTVNHAAGMNPRPFIFDAADMNHDSEIDILDVVGIIRTILNPSAAATASVESSAMYYIEDGTLYIDTPVALAGVQVNINMPRTSSATAASALDGFEKTGAWIADDEYIFLAYTMRNLSVPSGSHAILNLGPDAAVKAVKLAAPDGSNVLAVEGNQSTGVGSVSVDTAAPAGVYTPLGIKLADDAEALERLPRGIYIVNGTKIVK